MRECRAEHSGACRRSYAARLRAQAAYDERWPNRCGRCLTHTSCDYPCPECLLGLRCPRCGTAQAMHPEDATRPCTQCGFEEGHQKDVRPPDHECRCRVAVAARRAQERVQLLKQRAEVEQRLTEIGGRS